MNFGSTFALHDSDDEEEVVHEDIPSGPLSCMSPAVVEQAPHMPRSVNVQSGLFGSASGGWDGRGRHGDHWGRGGRGGPGGLGYQERSISTRHTQVFNNVPGSSPRQLEPGNTLRPIHDRQVQDPSIRNMNRSSSFAAPTSPLNKLSTTRVPAVRMDCATSGTQARSRGLRITGVEEEVVDDHPSSHLSPVTPSIRTPGAYGQAEAAQSSGRGRTWTRKVNTNILNVDMAALGNAAPLATGDPTFCSGCGACLSALSILRPAGDAKSSIGGSDGGTSSRAPTGVVEGIKGTDKTELEKGYSAPHEGDEGMYIWICEFCSAVNRVDLDDMEKPSQGQDSVDYVLEGATPASASAAGRDDSGNGENAKDDSAVLFVVDVSGSMCVTTPVPGHLSFRGDRTRDMDRLLNPGDGRDQLMPKQPRSVTYVSRLQAMQAAINTQIETMAKGTPDRHAGLVTFNGEVSLIGDGSGDARVVAGYRLCNEEALRDVGRSYPLSQSVLQARERLSDRLFALEEGGPTALGPAVIVGLSMLKERGGRGSRMVLCTDGLANVGLGALDDLQTDDKRGAVEEFYESLGREAAENGVTVDVISVDSDACDLENLGTMADVSGGSVTRVKTSELTSNFAGILANPILASQVSVRVTLHKGLTFRNAGIDASANTLARDMGNVTRETELTFEYQVRPKEQRQAMGLRSVGGILHSPCIMPVFDSTGYSTLSSRPANSINHPKPIAPPSKGLGLAPPQTRRPLSFPSRAWNRGTASTQGGSAPFVFSPSQDAGEARHESPNTAEANNQSEDRAFLPFQVQIRYTRPDGMRCLRVITRTQQVTRDKRKAERSIQMAVVAGHAASQAGRLASCGAYTSTRVSMRAWGNLMQRNAQDERSREQISQYSSEMRTLDSELFMAQRRERVDNDEGGTIDPNAEMRTYGRQRKATRSSNDTLASAAFATKSSTSKRYC